jgi:hypothetical protein
MTKQVDYDYFEWLTGQVHIPNDKTYTSLFERMHNLEFVWTVPNDDNRIQDGKDLRNEFLGGSRRHLSLEWVSMLEVLISLSRRTAFTAGGEAPRWAWKLLKNLRLTRMSDPLNEFEEDMIDETLNAVIWRTYQRDGRGGFFPLKHPAEDQTKVEIAYQLNAYVIEMERS